MRIIKSEEITEAVRDLCITSNYDLPSDIYDAICQGRGQELTDLAKETLDVIKENANVAKKRKRPICQDTGMAVVFCEVGDEVFVEGNLKEAINKVVALGYQEGYLRKSIVKDPVFDRVNTNDNTPAVIHYDVVPGDQLKITVAPKGFGSENMCQIKMLKPSDGIEGVKHFIMKVVEDAGPNPCPPIVVGVGIGGNFESVALLAKKAMMKDVHDHHPDARYQEVEEEMLKKINDLGIGPAGFGGSTTALSLHIETAPTHIAGMPVAVAICCHVARHKEVVL
jgi:fumarate hydratase subunit alpha